MKVTGKILKFIAILMVIWVVVAILVPCGGANGLARSTNLRHLAIQLQGQSLTFDLLSNSIEKLPLNIGVTHYTADIQYEDTTHWKFRLNPRPVQAYTADLPIWNRILKMNFYRHRYPIIEVTSR